MFLWLDALQQMVEEFLYQKPHCKNKRTCRDREVHSVALQSCHAGCCACSTALVSMCVCLCAKRLSVCYWYSEWTCTSASRHPVPVYECVNQVKRSVLFSCSLQKVWLEGNGGLKKAESRNVFDLFIVQDNPWPKYIKLNYKKSQCNWVDMRWLEIYIFFQFLCYKPVEALGSV